MPVFEYAGVTRSGEEKIDTGVIVASSEEAALYRLRSRRLTEIELVKLKGLAALRARFAATLS